MKAGSEEFKQMNKHLLYKLTDQARCTYAGFEWPAPEANKWVKTDGRGQLCGPGWLHAYTSPELAVLLNPIHADISKPVCWELAWQGDIKHDKGLKVGVTEARLVRAVKLPEFTTHQHVAFGIYCALAVYTDKPFVAWADNWLNGSDRSMGAARARVEAAKEWAEGSAKAAGAWAAWAVTALAPKVAEAWAAQAAKAAAKAAAEAAAEAAAAEAAEAAAKVWAAKAVAAKAVAAKAAAEAAAEAAAKAAAEAAKAAAEAAAEAAAKAAAEAAEAAAEAAAAKTSTLNLQSLAMKAYNFERV